MLPWPYVVIILSVALFIIGSIITLAVCYSRRTESKNRPNERRMFKSSKWITPTILLAIRIVSFGFSLSVLVSFLAIEGIEKLQYYTVWCFALIVIYFGCGAICSIRAVREHQQSGLYPTIPLTDLGRVTQIFFEIALPMAFLVTVLNWAVLFPLDIRDGATEQELNETYINFWGFTMHGVNVLILTVEFFLNKIPFYALDIFYAMLWPCSYAIFIFILNSVTQSWPYAIMATDLPIALAWYSTLFVLHVLFFFIFFGLSRIKLTLDCTYDPDDDETLDWGSKTVTYVVDENTLLKGQDPSLDWKTTLYGTPQRY